MFIAAIIFVVLGVFLALEFGYLVIVIMDWLILLFMEFLVDRYEARNQPKP